jgi:hypothetical protein
MSITVVIARDDVGSPTTREVYADGVKFTTEGGDLSILSSKPSLLATYGSGNWLSVHVDDYVQVIVDRPEESSDDSFSFGDDDDDPFASSDSTDADAASSDTDFSFDTDDEDEDDAKSGDG